MNKEKCFSCNIELKEAYTDNEKITLSARLVCDYSPLVHSPKITAVFKCGKETRYLPFLITSYFPNEDLKTCTILADYTFNIEYLFLKPVEGKSISLRFNFEYGDNYIQGINLDYSVAVDNVYGDHVYHIFRREGCNYIEFYKKPEFISEKQPNKFLLAVKFIISKLYNFILRLIGYICIPLFFIDAIMAKLGLTGYRHKLDFREGILFFIDHIRLRFKAITKQNVGRSKFKKNLAKRASKLYSKSEIKQNRITFLSNRRNDLSGNFEYIYDILKDDDSLDIQMLLDPTPLHRMSNKNIIKFAKLYATSKVVIIDDFYELTSKVPKKDDVKLVQVWHACGAFKTFGFSRLGKPGGPRQKSLNHRCYDYAIVSSENIRRCYAEGFGISINKVVATGVPRTDIFFDQNYKIQKQKEFFEQYPKLKNKKIMLFAPTFRGNGRLTGSYPIEKFNLKTIYEQTNGEYAIIVKLHPFIKEKFVIPNKYKDYILDFSDKSELNDLLFVTDLLVSDYSSAIFEASLLNTPMLFYAFDLNEYISKRDFYCEYKSFLPGKIVYDLQEFLNAVNEKDFETEKIEPFRNKFFDVQDGGSAIRVANLIQDIIKK